LGGGLSGHHSAGFNGGTLERVLGWDQQIQAPRRQHVVSPFDEIAAVIVQNFDRITFAEFF
jgi:hypothetical protein